MDSPCTCHAVCVEGSIALAILTTTFHFLFERTTLDVCVSIDIAEKIQDYVPRRP